MLEFAPTDFTQLLKPAIPTIPAWRTALEAAIHESLWMLDLADDWDGDALPVLCYMGIVPRIPFDCWQNAALN